MAKNDVDVTFTSNLKAFYNEFDPAVKKTLEEWGIEGEAHGKEIAIEKGVKDTGYTVNSITWAIGGEKANIASYKADKGNAKGTYSGTAPKRDEPSVYIGTNAWYAPYNELGTSKMPARPFIRPAVEDFGDQYKEIAERNLGEIK